MKLTKLTAVLLVATTAFGVTMLSACKKNTVNTPDNPLDNFNSSSSDLFNGNSTDSIINPGIIGSATYDPSAEHGERRVYGRTSYSGIYARRSSLDTWGNYYFDYDYAWLLCYDRTGQSAPIQTCFDPLCNHHVDTCPAFYQFDWYDNGERMYPYYIFCDYYDNANAPVFYSVYRRSDVGHIGTEVFDRDPYYLIQRYDISSGERVTLQSNIQDLVHSAYTFGDYLYYTTSKDYLASQENAEDSTYALCALPKTGGEPIVLQNGTTYALEILDITEEGVYYIVNGQYIYRCSLTLENPTRLLDVYNIKDENGSNTMFVALQDNSLYYFGNLDIIDTPYFSNLYAGDCYRMSLSDMSVSVKLAEDLICSVNMIALTENYFYYQPAVMSEANGGLYPVNYSNGVVKAVNISTGETVTCCENTGISFFTGYVMEDDSITVYGQAYDPQGEGLAGKSYNHIRLYPDGRQFEIWFNSYTEGNGFVIE